MVSARVALAIEQEPDVDGAVTGRVLVTLGALGLGVVLIGGTGLLAWRRRSAAQP